MQYWWDDAEHTILRLDVGEGTSWDEYHQVMEAMLREVAAAGHRVDLIMQVFGNMPPGNPLPHLKRNMDAMVNTPNFGAVLLVGRERVSTFGQHIISLLLHLYGRDTPSKSVFCASLEEAYAALARLRDREDG